MATRDYDYGSGLRIAGTNGNDGDKDVTDVAEGTGDSTAAEGQGEPGK